VATRAGVEPAWNEMKAFASINLYPTAPHLVLDAKCDGCRSDDKKASLSHATMKLKSPTRV